MQQSNRKLAEDELIDTEVTYISELKILIDSFVKPLRSWAEELKNRLQDPDFSPSSTSLETYFNEEACGRLFSNIEQLLTVNEMLLDDFRASDNKAESLNRIAPYLKMYSIYINNFDTSSDILTRLMSDERFSAFIRACELQKTCHGLDIRSFLILPVQRIPRYRLLLLEMLKRTETESVDCASLSQALKTVESVASRINTNIYEQERRNKVIAIQEAFNLTSLLTPSRIFVIDGSLSRICSNASKKRYYFVLFNDLLIYGSESGSKKIRLSVIGGKGSQDVTKKITCYKLVKQVPLSFCEVVNIIQQESLANDAPLALIAISTRFCSNTSDASLLTDSKSILIQFSTNKEKLDWMTNLRRYIDQTRSSIGNSALGVVSETGSSYKRVDDRPSSSSSSDRPISSSSITAMSDGVGISSAAMRISTHLPNWWLLNSKIESSSSTSSTANSESSSKTEDNEVNRTSFKTSSLLGVTVVTIEFPDKLTQLRSDNVDGIIRIGQLRILRSGGDDGNRDDDDDTVVDEDEDKSSVKRFFGMFSTSTSSTTATTAGSKVDDSEADVTGATRKKLTADDSGQLAALAKIMHDSTQRDADRYTPNASDLSERQNLASAVASTAKPQQPSTPMRGIFRSASGKQVTDGGGQGQSMPTTAAVKIEPSSSTSSVSGLPSMPQRPPPIPQLLPQPIVPMPTEPAVVVEDVNDNKRSSKSFRQTFSNTLNRKFKKGTGGKGNDETGGRDSESEKEQVVEQRLSESNQLQPPPSPSGFRLSSLFKSKKQSESTTQSVVGSTQPTSNKGETSDDDDDGLVNVPVDQPDPSTQQQQVTTVEPISCEPHRFMERRFFVVRPPGSDGRIGLLVRTNDAQVDVSNKSKFIPGALVTGFQDEACPAAISGIEVGDVVVKISSGSSMHKIQTKDDVTEALKVKSQIRLKFAVLRPYNPAADDVGLDDLAPQATVDLSGRIHDMAAQMAVELQAADVTTSPLIVPEPDVIRTYNNNSGKPPPPPPKPPKTPEIHRRVMSGEMAHAIPVPTQSSVTATTATTQAVLEAIHSSNTNSGNNNNDRPISIEAAIIIPTDAASIPISDPTSKAGGAKRRMRRVDFHRNSLFDSRKTMDSDDASKQSTEGGGDGVAVEADVEASVKHFRSFSKTMQTDLLLNMTPSELEDMGIDTSKKEQYMSESEFQSTFDISKKDFMKLPIWKRNELKKSKGFY